MQVFQELYIHGTPDQLRATREVIAALISGGWARDAEIERRMRNASPPRLRNPECYSCQRRGPRPEVTLFLLDKDATTDHVANIVPHDSPDLTHAQYNGLLEEFFTHFVRPAAERTGARAELTAPDADLERWLSERAAEKLRLFCAAANKRTGAANPADRKLWYDFVVAAHRDGAVFSATTLARWLHEAGGWDEEWADRLATQYEQERGVLEFADRQAIGA
jgi:hypothetical protein